MCVTVDVHLWYPADTASAAARPLTTYTSALNGRALIPGKTPLSWRIDAELAREGATILAGSTPLPVIVFSHGSNNDPIDYAHTLEGVASAGFIIAAPYHTNNSQEDVRIDAANAAGASPPVPCNDTRPAPCSRLDVPTSIADRVKDVSAIISSLPTWFGPRADTFRVGMMGHSRGTATALAATGGTNYGVVPDPRVRAVMGMAIAVQAIANNISIANVKVPLLMVAGSKDATSPPAVSLYAYNQAASVDKQNVVIENGFHRTFDSTYCDQVQSAGTIARADANAVLDRQTFNQIAVHPSSGGAVDYCARSTFTAPVASLIQEHTGFTVTDTNVPTSTLDTDTVKTQMTAMAIDFFTRKLAYVAGGGVSATVPATLALTLGPAASFGAFTPGVAREYTTTTGATVTSTAGDATLSVGDPGRLTNGAFSLPQPLQVSFSRSSWAGPTSNEGVTVTFKQAIGANDALRTGSYSKTLTFTLSTTTP